MQILFLFLLILLLGDLMPAEWHDNGYGKWTVAGKKHTSGGIAVIAGFPLETVQPFEQRKQPFKLLINILEDSE